jgi:hypothetical protein
MSRAQIRGQIKQINITDIERRKQTSRKNQNIEKRTVREKLLSNIYLKFSLSKP